MQSPKVSPEASGALEKFLDVFPRAAKETYRSKTYKALEYLMLRLGVAEASIEILLQALDDALPKSFEPLIMRLRDPQSLSGLVGAQQQIANDNPLVKVRRWGIPGASSKMPVKNVLALLASPRKGGNTDCILNAMLEGVREAGAEVDKYVVADLAIAPCIGCMACEQRELPTYCAIQDDMTGIYKKFLEYDAFVMGFPVYTARECSQAAIFFDRLKALRNKGRYNMPGKIRKGALVVTWGWPSDEAYSHVVENAAFVLNLFGVETAEIVTGSGFWDAYYAKGTAALDTAGMAQARTAGRVLVTG